MWWYKELSDLVAMLGSYTELSDLVATLGN